MSDEGLVYVGKIVDLQPIPSADFIVSATVVCGKGGKWRGVVRKTDFAMNDLCVVFLPDALIPEREDMAFMKATGWRVKMRRFKGAPSEVVIMPWDKFEYLVGMDITEQFSVTKYHKPVPAHLQGLAKGLFPSFIPKTDEPNYQSYGDLVDRLVGQPYYITEKADGSSTTAFRYKGEFGVCSRNLELQRDENNGYWKIAIKYKLEENLPEGYALQWETCGPRIQSNPMGLKEIEGFAFSAYKIDEHRYLDMQEFLRLVDSLKFPICQIVSTGMCFDKKGIELLGEGFYVGMSFDKIGEGFCLNQHEREGVVVRSQLNYGHAPISFKVINLNYEK